MNAMASPHGSTDRNCWSFTKRSWGSPVGLGLPPAARSAVPCKIMGIGNAGCDSALHSAQSGAVLTNAEWVAEGCGDDIAMDDFFPFNTRVSQFACAA